jgi:hypothetical protein
MMGGFGIQSREGASFRSLRRVDRSENEGPVVGGDEAVGAVGRSSAAGERTDVPGPEWKRRRAVRARWDCDCAGLISRPGG